jgi:histidyl-tRNA synthetase
VSFGEAELAYCLPWLQAVRKAGIASEIYPESVKMKKQMGYADAKKIPYVAIVGGDEMAQGKVKLKNMSSGEQGLVSLEELIHEITIS